MTPTTTTPPADDTPLGNAIERQLDAITQRYPDVDRRYLRRHLRSLADDAASIGAQRELSRLMSGYEAAEALGLSRSWITRLARRHGIGRQIGDTWVFTPDDLPPLREAAAAARPGRPPLHRE